VALDRRLWRRARSARAAVAAAVALGVATASALIAQTWLLAALVAGPERSRGTLAALLGVEPTAGLDGATEADVVRAIRRLVCGRTVVLVAHRPALLAIADRVIDLSSIEAPA
jgi:energy-coupling factor transporter ATP-binding protein EcfA2